jgi:hypothetical protein
MATREDPLAIIGVVFASMAAFVVAFVIAIPFAVYFWRRKARVQSNRCCTCGYRIDNVAGPNCPECGTTFDVGDGWSPKEMHTRKNAADG